MSNVSVIIPALNEEEPIAEVVRECLAIGLPNDLIVVDNGSTDRTAQRAREAGARVVTAPRGYGRACAAGVRALSPDCQIVVFLDGDGSDVPAMMNKLVDPIARGAQDFVIGSRTAANFVWTHFRIHSAATIRRPLHRHVPIPRHSARCAWDTQHA